MNRELDVKELNLKLKLLDGHSNYQLCSSKKTRFMNKTWRNPQFSRMNSVGNSPTSSTDTSPRTSPQTSPIYGDTTLNNWLQSNNASRSYGFADSFCKISKNLSKQLIIHKTTPSDSNKLNCNKTQAILKTKHSRFTNKNNYYQSGVIKLQKSLRNRTLLTDNQTPVLRQKQNLKKKLLKNNQQQIIHQNNQIIHQDIKIIHQEQTIINQEQKIIHPESEKKLIAPRGRPISGCKFPVIVRPNFASKTEFTAIIDSKDDDNPSESLLCRPWGVTVTKDGYIIVCDRTHHRIIIFLEDGTVFKKFGEEGMLPGQFKIPAGIAVDINQRLIIADKDNHRVQIMTLDGDFISSFGEKGSEPGQFHYPWDVAVNDSCEIVVSDTRNNRVQLFNSNGELMRVFGYVVTKETLKFFDSPRGIAFNRDGNIVMTDFNTHSVVVIKYDFLSAQILDNDEVKFLRPQGIIVDDSGHIIITESRGNKIQILDRDGTLVWKFDTSIGSGDHKINYPTGVALTPSGKILVADCNNNRILLI